MSKLSFGVAALVALALLITTIGQRRSETRLRAEIAQLQRERDNVRVVAGNVERRASDLRATLAAEIAKEVPEPAIPLTPLSETQLTSLDLSYAALFRHLRLPDEKLNTLRQLLIERQKREVEARRFAREKGLPVDDLTVTQLKKLYPIWNRAIDARIRALVGESDYAYFEFFVRTNHHRPIFNELAGLLDRTEWPLRDEQIDQLVAWTVECTPANVRPFEQKPAIPDEVLGRAASILNSVQMEKLILVREARDAMIQTFAMNRAAAQQGLLNLTRQSAQDYPSRNAKTGVNP